MRNTEGTNKWKDRCPHVWEQLILYYTTKQPYIYICIYVYICIFMAAAAKSLQLCPTQRDPIDGSPRGSTVPGILQARTLEWVAISFFNAWKWKAEVKLLSHVWLFVTPWTAAYQASPSMWFSRQDTGVGCHWLLQYSWQSPSKHQRHFFTEIEF